MTSLRVPHGVLSEWLSCGYCGNSMVCSMLQLFGRNPGDQRILSQPLQILMYCVGDSNKILIYIEEPIF